MAIVEVRINVAMAFQDIHDLKNVVSILKKDNICPVCDASHIRPQFRSSASQCSRQSGEIKASPTELGGKVFRKFNASALFLNVIKNIEDVALSIREIA